MPVLDNARHEAFAQALAKGKTADQAYADAGYSANRGNAARMNANESVKARVAELQALKVERIMVDKQWVISNLVDNVERAMQAQEIVVAGKPTGEYRYDGSVANRALELIGKELGMFVEKTEGTLTVTDGTERDAERFVSGIAGLAARVGKSSSTRKFDA